MITMGCCTSPAHHSTTNANNMKTKFRISKKKTKKVYDAAGRLVSERHVLNDAVIDRWVGRRATE